MKWEQRLEREGEGEREGARGRGSAQGWRRGSVKKGTYEELSSSSFSKDPAPSSEPWGTGTHMCRDTSTDTHVDTHFLNMIFKTQ